MFEIVVGVKDEVVNQLNEINKDHRIKIISFINHYRDDKYSVLIHKSEIIREPITEDSFDDMLKNIK